MQSRDPVVVVSVLEELRQRDGIFIALKDRDDTMLEPLITFLAKYITNPRYSAVLITLANTLLGTRRVHARERHGQGRGQR